jgi:hypothetical protein
MDTLNQSINKNDQANKNKALWPLIVIIILMMIAIGVAWQFTGDRSEPIVIDEPIVIVEELPEITETVEILPEPVVERPEAAVIETEIDEPIKEPLPLLDNSDNWLKLKLPEITWRKELLKLIIDEDMIRRFVVFTDNFAQGVIAYEHSPFTLPKTKFTTEIKSNNVKKSSQNFAQTTSNNSLVLEHSIWQWDENSSRRFSLYVDLLRSMDSESLVKWYSEVKPLIDEAYSELGYEDDFTNTLQDAITRVLDMELPKSPMELIQPSVMYKFADPTIEALPDADKLLLRLGKENLLVMKSILLELHEKLAQQVNGIH